MNRQIRLFNLPGKETLSIAGFEKTIHLNIADLPRGVYLLNVFDNGLLIAAEKLVKE